MVYSYNPSWVIEIFKIYTDKGKSKTISPIGSYSGLLEFEVNSINKNSISYVIVKSRPHFIILRLVLFSSILSNTLFMFSRIYILYRLKR